MTTKKQAKVSFTDALENEIQTMVEYQSLCPLGKIRKDEMTDEENASLEAAMQANPKQVPASKIQRALKTSGRPVGRKCVEMCKYPPGGVCCYDQIVLGKETSIRPTSPKA